MDFKPNTKQLRDFQIIQKSHPGTTYFGLNSVSYDGASIWNSLPNEIKDVIAQSRNSLRLLSYGKACHASAIYVDQVKLISKL